MNKPATSLFCLFLLSICAAAQPASAPEPENFATSGNAFLRVCEPASRAGHFACTVYVIGVGDGAEMLSEERLHEPLYCPSPDVENGQKYRIVVKYIKEHPERVDSQTRVLIVDALTAAFPCHPAK